MTVGLVAALVLVAGVQAVRIHAQDGRWALVPSVAPERLDLAGRTYARGDRSEMPGEDLVERGHTSGGGMIYTLAGDTDPSVVLWVRKGEQAWAYGLLGGP